MSENNTTQTSIYTQVLTEAKYLVNSGKLNAEPAKHLIHLREQLRDRLRESRVSDRPNSLLEESCKKALEELQKAIKEVAPYGWNLSKESIADIEDNPVMRFAKTKMEEHGTTSPSPKMLASWLAENKDIFIADIKDNLGSLVDILADSKPGKRIKAINELLQSFRLAKEMKGQDPDAYRLPNEAEIYALVCEAKFAINSGKINSERAVTLIDERRGLILAARKANVKNWEDADDNAAVGCIYCHLKRHLKELMPLGYDHTTESMELYKKARGEDYQRTVDNICKGGEMPQEPFKLDYISAEDIVRHADVDGKVKENGK